MTVSVRYLLEGAWYALEQCGRLLHDAIDLYERDRFGTAVGLAILAREELGKARILIQLSGEVEAGKGLSPRELSGALADHLEKQEHAQISVVLSAGYGTRLQELFKKAGDPSDPEFEAANVELEKIQEQKRRRMRQERHSLRQRAMYVDPQTGGWNRPGDFTKEVSRDELIYAMNDYSMMRHNLDVAEKYSRVRECLSDWPGRPELPERRWPKVLD